MKKIIRKSSQLFRFRSSDVLAAVSIAGMIVTTVLAVKETPKALQLITEAQETRGTLTYCEKAVIGAKAYFPAIVSGGLTISCIAGISMLDKRHQASLAGAYALVDNAYKDYRRKAKDLYGEDADAKITKSIAIEQAEKINLYAPGLWQACDLSVEDDDASPWLFYEPVGRRFFSSTIERVMSAEYHLNRNYTLRGYADLNELYSFLGLELIPAVSELGWTVIDDNEFYWIDFNNRKVSDDQGFEYYVIETEVAPFLLSEYYC